MTGRPFWTDGTVTIRHGNALALPLDDQSVDLVVTSPPYFGLRSYQDDGAHYDGQVGSEATPREFLDALIAATREMVRVLKPSGSIFVNLGDKYSSTSTPGPQSQKSTMTGGRHKGVDHVLPRRLTPGAPNKSLMLLPERYRIRCVDACGEGRRPVSDRWVEQVRAGYNGRAARADNQDENTRGFNDKSGGIFAARRNITGYVCACPDTSAPTRPAKVLDPFAGTGTVAVAARAFGRHAELVDLSLDYCRLQRWRVTDPGERARALQVEKPKPVPVNADALFDLGPT